MFIPAVAVQRVTMPFHTSSMSVAESERVAVWIVLAQLYLDTAHDELDLQRIARELARSPFSVAELREIEVWEVAPVVLWNVMIPAGVWDAFDSAWLAAECGRRARRRSWWLRVAVGVGWRRVVAGVTGVQWGRITPVIGLERGGVEMG
ncbi:MAG: DUF7079 family protein [Gemmatimonas sp.]